VFFRILIWSVVFFFLARFLWRLMSPFLSPSHPGRQPDNVPEPPPKTKEEFKDVRDAKFIDVPKSPSDSNGDEKEKSEN